MRKILFGRFDVAKNVYVFANPRLVLYMYAIVNEWTAYDCSEALRKNISGRYAKLLRSECMQIITSSDSRSKNGDGGPWNSSTGK